MEGLNLEEWPIYTSFEWNRAWIVESASGLHHMKSEVVEINQDRSKSSRHLENIAWDRKSSILLVHDQHDEG